VNEATHQEIGRWRRAGHEVAVATVVRTRRSSPRPVGSVFAVSSTGAVAGSVSGGCVEGAIHAEAQDLLAGGGGPRVLHYGISDDLAAGVGLACGGEIWVALDRFRERPALRRGAIATVLSGPQAGARLVLDADAGAVDAELAGKLRELALGAASEAAARERSDAVDLEDGTLLFVEAVAPPPRVVVVGAVDTAEALCRLARTLGWRTVVADPRRLFATAERLPSAGEIVVAWPAEAYDQVALEPSDAVVVLTHDPKIDDEAIAAALARRAAYVGALGSRRTQAQRRDRLVAAGVPEVDVARVRGPVGLDIGARTPAETAVSIVAEVLAERSGRRGDPLVVGDGPIHAHR
jgi:xanthine dehydrogenase accessory factor